MTTPEVLRAKFQRRSTHKVVSGASRLRVDPVWDLETAATARALQALARRALELSTEAKAHKQQLSVIVRNWRPDLLDENWRGPIAAAVLLCAWSHAGRCRSEEAFAMLGGSAPIPASSGMTVRHRLNRSGDRQLNRALYTIVVVRLRHEPATKAYLERRTQEGRTPAEIKRCLKRYVPPQITGSWSTAHHDLTAHRSVPRIVDH